MNNKAKGMTIYEVACDIVNTIIKQTHQWASLGLVGRTGLGCVEDSEDFKLFADMDYIQQLVTDTYGTEDGKNDDLEMVVKLVHHVLNYHIEKGDLHTIMFISPKGENQGWTSHHMPVN